MIERFDLERVLAPSPTSAKGSLGSPGLRILSHKGRGKSPGRLSSGLPLPLWERIASPHATQSNAWARLVRGHLNCRQFAECAP
jgi:hypothetical protein